MGRVKLDEIDYWSEVKLDIVKEYAAAYSRIINARLEIRRHAYIDAFAGAGVHLSKRKGEFIPGSPLNALYVTPPFREFHFIDLHGGKADRLRQMTPGRKDVFVYEGDCNRILLDEVFLRCRYNDYHRALCLLDPYALNVNWEVLQTAGDMGSVDIFYNFMIMDMNMNVVRHNIEKVQPAQIARMDFAWGDRSWREAAYRKQPGLFGEMDEKVTNVEVANAFRKRLRDVAGFTYVPEPLPMRNSKGAVIYYLFFASPNKTGAKIVQSIFDKYRQRGVI
ncbi:MAG: three-Cys-motif partner protein TcmP [Thermodesulfobacteriota bacterium]